MSGILGKGSQTYFLSNKRVKAQDEFDGPYIKTTLIGPSDYIDEAKELYFLHYPRLGYDTEIVYEGTIVVEKKHGLDKILVLRRLLSCD